MKTDKLRFKCPATAREYIRNLAFNFEESEQMMEFLNACDIAQAAFVNCLIKEQQYNFMLRNHYLNRNLANSEFMVEIEVLYNEYFLASEELLQAKNKLKIISFKLDLNEIDRKLTKG